MIGNVHMHSIRFSSHGAYCTHIDSHAGQRGHTCAAVLISTVGGLMWQSAVATSIFRLKLIICMKTYKCLELSSKGYISPAPSLSFLPKHGRSVVIVTIADPQFKLYSVYINVMQCHRLLRHDALYLLLLYGKLQSYAAEACLRDHMHTHSGCACLVPRDSRYFEIPSILFFTHIHHILVAGHSCGY